MIRIILADDHTIFRQGLAHLIAAEDDIQIVGQAGDGEAAWNQIKKHKPHVAVLDITMPKLNGIEICRLIEADAQLSCLVLLLTMHQNPLLAIEAKNAGAKGYVLKENTFEELADAVRAIHDGEVLVSPVIQEKIDALEKFGGTMILSERERQVLGAIARGNTNKEIARQLEISPKTVETYRNRIMDKLNMRSIAELSRFAAKLGLAE